MRGVLNREPQHLNLKTKPKREIEIEREFDGKEHRMIWENSMHRSTIGVPVRLGNKIAI